MTVEEALRAYILTLTAVRQITTTVRADDLAQGDTLPAVLINVNEETPQNDLDGHGGLVDVTVTISAISENKAEARRLAEAIRTNNTNPGTGLAGYTGLAGSLHIDAYLNTKVSGYIPEEDGTDTGLYSVDSHYTVWHQETV